MTKHLWGLPLTVFILNHRFIVSSAFVTPSTSTQAVQQNPHIDILHPWRDDNSNNHAKISSKTIILNMSEGEEQVQRSNLPVFLDPGTKGGAVVLSIILFIIPIIMYQVITQIFGVDEIEAGRNIGVGFCTVTMLLWGSTYIFRVATKDMTYAKQLKDYEDAVIAKRLEELDEDEVQALVEDIERDKF